MAIAQTEFDPEGARTLTCPGVGDTEGIFPGTAINEDSSDVDIALLELLKQEYWNLTWDLQ